MQTFDQIFDPPIPACSGSGFNQCKPSIAKRNCVFYGSAAAAATTSDSCVQQVRPLTVYQQQMLHMHIQSNKSLLMFIDKMKHFKILDTSPQARLQLQQLSPQLMRYTVLQRILQQQEQHQQTMHQAQTQPPITTPQMQAQPAGQMISNQGQRMGATARKLATGSTTKSTCTPTTTNRSITKRRLKA